MCSFGDGHEKKVQGAKLGRFGAPGEVLSLGGLGLAQLLLWLRFLG